MPSSSARSAMISLAPPGGGDEAEPVAGQRAGRGQQPGRDDEVFQAVDPDHAVLAEHRVDDRVVADQGAGVGAGDPGAGLAAADLDRDDRLALGEGLAREGEELTGVPDRLDEQGDDPGLLVVDEVAHDIGHRHHRLVAHGNQQADADVAGLGEGQHRAGQRPALQHDADRAAQQRGLDGEPVGGDAGRGVDEAVPVGAEDGEAPAAREVGHLPLELRPLLPRLGEAGGQQDNRADAVVGRLVEYGQDGRRRDHHEGEVDTRRQVGDAGVAVLAVHRDAARVHQVHGPVELVELEVAEGAPGPSRLVRGADQGDRPGVEQLPDLLGGAACGARHQGLSSGEWRRGQVVIRSGRQAFK